MGDDRWIIAQTSGDSLVCPPAADGVVVVECKSQRIDLLMTRSARRMSGVSFQLIANRGFGFVTRRRLKRFYIRRRRGRRVVVLRLLGNRAVDFVERGAAKVEGPC